MYASLEDFPVIKKRIVINALFASLDMDADRLARCPHRVHHNWRRCDGPLRMLQHPHWGGEGPVRVRRAVWLVLLSVPTKPPPPPPPPPTSPGDPPPAPTPAPPVAGETPSPNSIWTPSTLGPCHHNGDCISAGFSGSTCLAGGCCTVGAEQNCVACDASHNCVTCVDQTFYISGGFCKPKRADGANCTAKEQCLSGKCIGGHCCKKDTLQIWTPKFSGGTMIQVSSGCAACDAVGVRLRHLRLGVLLGLRELPRALAGAGHGSSNECWGNCSASKCCKPSIPTQCTACNAAGNCNACQAGYTITSDYYCFPDNCQKSLSTACTACAAGTAAGCTACAPNYYVNGTDCVPLQALGACVSSQQCYGNCSGGYCCKVTAPALCTACDAAGNCKSCPLGYRLTSDYFCLPNSCPLPGTTTPCLSCPAYSTASNTCTKCSPGYYNAKGACLPEGCNAFVTPACTSCDADWNCATCKVGFYWTRYSGPTPPRAPFWNRPDSRARRTTGATRRTAVVAFAAR